MPGHTPVVPDYRRNRVPGGTCLLHGESARPRRSTSTPGSCFPTTCTACGLCRTEMPTSPVVGARSRPRSQNLCPPANRDHPSRPAGANAAFGSGGARSSALGFAATRLCAEHKRHIRHWLESGGRYSAAVTLAAGRRQIPHAVGLAMFFVHLPCRNATGVARPVGPSVAGLMPVRRPVSPGRCGAVRRAAAAAACRATSRISSGPHRGPPSSGGPEYRGPAG